MSAQSVSLRSKRFQSCYCAKVRAEAKKRHVFLLFSPSFLDEPREKRLLRRLAIGHFRPLSLLEDSQVRLMEEWEELLVSV